MTKQEKEAQHGAQAPDGAPLPPSELPQAAPPPSDAEEPTPLYFEYAPQDGGGDLVDNAHVGEVYPGRIVEVRRHLVDVFQGDPDWKRSSHKKYEEQEPIHEAVARIRTPHTDDEE